MIRLLSGRLLGAIPTLFAIVLLGFALMRLAPGGPFDAERALPPEVEAALRAQYDLDAPLHAQFARYLTDLAHFDLGPSFKYKDFTVAELIRDGAPVSMTLGLAALVLAAGLGISLGCAAALRRGSRFDTALMGLAVSGQVIPTFVVGPILALVFGLWLRWLPLAGWGGGRLAFLVLPVITLALPYVAAIARLMRASLAETLSENFIRTARARGASPARILLRHALPPALLPVVSYLGPAAAGLLTGSVVVETIFGLPGIGRYFVQGAINRDYTLVLGVVMLYGGVIVLFNMATDLIYGWLDPRVRRA
ncbi:oligopeptide ABC transporter permease OppB [Pedomonas mirosovicensis]|uniref:oligopeptide ABC transporter permease OppB n=1 Tax=Pedomonas mirosovicensis TaxID=2908641 RepID=UPI002166EEB1|nr:oligopeptide ABC transporter permease OppB [Pedomonas mirosovicensis]MCH8683798.1 oligopeptide ABC transporter permease OppB [Pedomonas mirosovicensis]